MSIAKEIFQKTHFPNISLRPRDVNVTSVTWDPVHFKGILSTPLRIDNNVPLQDFYVVSGFQHDWALGTDFLTQACISIDM